MATNNLKNAVIAALDRIGRVRTLEIAPELASLEGWTNESLAGIMTDVNDIICDEKHQENILSLMEFFCSTQAAQNERKPHFDAITDSLAATLRYQLNTVGINYSSGNPPKSITAALGTADATKDYVPVVGVVVGKEKGPFKAALESMFNLLYRGTAPPLLASRFATSVLRLWRAVLQTWIQTTLERETSPELEIVELTAAAPATRAKVHRGTVPIIEIDIEPARPARTQRIKRSHSVKEDDPPPRPHKRKAIPTPPSTPAVEELSNRQALPFIAALINAIPPHPSPSSESGVDVTYTFRRQRFSDEFGSNAQALESSWKRYDEGHRLHRKNRPPGAGSEHLIGGQTKFNPHFPQTPCARGLLYRAPGFTYKFGNEANTEPYRNTVLFHVAQSKWLYLGEYVVKYKCSLPRAEWVSSTDEFKDGWIEHLTEKPNRYDAPQVPPQEMLESLDDGRLKLEVYEMKCVGYDLALQAKIIELGL